MRVRFLTSVAGANFAYRQGRHYDLPDHIARDFIRSRQAEAVIEEAVAPATENAMIRRRRRAAH